MKQNQIFIVLILVGIIFLSYSNIKLPLFSFVVDNSDGIIVAPQIQKMTWLNQELTLTSPILQGSKSSSTSFRVCGDDSGGVTLSSYYSTSGSILNLQATSSGCGGNYIEAKGNLTPSQLRIIFTIPSGTPPASGEVIGGELVVNAGSCNFDNAFLWNEVDARSGRNKDGVRIYTCNLDKTSPVFIKLYDYGVSSSVKIEYTEPVVFCTEDYAPVCCEIGGVQVTKSNECKCTGTVLYVGECSTTNNTAVYYRFENNVCTSIVLTTSQRTINDYPTLEECTSKIIVIPNKTLYYRLSNNACSTVQLLPSEVTTSDYTTMALCQSHITTPPETPWYSKVIFTLGTFEVQMWLLLTVIGGAVLLLLLRK